MPDPIRVLIADDHPLFREGVAYSLSGDPEFEVVAQVGSGEEAVEATRRLVPDAVLLDIAMPGMGGIAAAGQVAREPPHTRIVMLTVGEDHDSLLASLTAGAHGFVLIGGSPRASCAASPAEWLLAEFSRPPTPDPVSDLTARETETLSLIGQGLTNREIGAQIHLAEKTVKHYVTVILEKLQVRNRTEAALVAVRRDAPGFQCAGRGITIGHLPRGEGRQTPGLAPVCLLAGHSARASPLYSGCARWRG